MALSATGLGRRIAAGALVALLAAQLVTTLRVATEDSLQRQDYRGAIERIGVPDAERALLLRPGYAIAPLWAYDRFPMDYVAGAPVREVVVMGHEAGAHPPLPAAFEGFELVERAPLTDMGFARYRASEAITLDAAAMAALGEPLRLDVR